MEVDGDQKKKKGSKKNYKNMIFQLIIIIDIFFTFCFVLLYVVSSL